MEKICVVNATKGFVKNEISKSLTISNEAAEILLNSLQELEPSNLVFSTCLGFPESKPGYMQLMTMIKKYNINISKAVLSVLSWLLGFIPVLGDISSLSELGKNLKESISILTDEEKAIIVFLRSLSNNGEIELKISNIRRTFRKYARNTTFFKEEANLNAVLDSLAEKGLIKIKTETILIIK